MPAKLRLKRRSKYRAVPVQSPDGYFHSTKEYRKWCELKLLERAGKIESLQRQCPVPIFVTQVGTGGKVHVCNWFADFQYRDCETNEWITEDCKGFRTKEYRLKKKLVEALYNIEIKET